MDPIISALEEERIEAKRLISRYEQELEALPRGSFFLRKLGKNRYGYLTCSEGGEIRQKYLGRLSEDEIKQYQQQSERKKKVLGLRNKAEKRYAFLERALKHAGRQG